MAGEGELLLQSHQEMRVISKKETGQPSAGDARPVAIAGAAEGLNPAALPTNGSADPVAQCSCADAWLIAITAESNQRMTSIQERRKPRIQKVADLLRKDKNKKALFEPEVVSLGPYHHGRPEFAAMEENKKAAAARFAGGQAVPMHLFYEKVRAVAGAARDCYADEFDISEEAFAEMMFFDGCFILHFIDCCCPKEGKSTAPTTKAHLHGFITRDLFLLENQVPLVVLQALMSLRPVDYERFISKVTGPTKPSKPGAKKRWWSSGSETRESRADEGHLHLLDLLRTRLLAGELPQNLRSMEANWQCFRSAMELKEAGITFRKSDTRCLRDVEFRKGRVQYGELQLPQIVVDDLTQTRFLNLIALEMCPDSNSDYGVTSYICFLDRLIDHADDVKELRRKEILLNALGSDQHVADLFNELATGLSQDHFAYSGVVAGIDRHYKNMWKVSVLTMRHTHFRSPWTTISFIAAVFLIILTAVQTIFTVFPKFAVDNH